MKTMKKVSIIIPVYNVENYLYECLYSVLHQTYKNIEIVLINDGSTDNSRIICEKIAKKDSRVKVINQLNKGVSNARNTGIKIATGDYIIFIDSDDVVDKEYISCLVKYNNNCEMVCCEYSNFKDNPNERLYDKQKLNICDEVFNYNSNQLILLYKYKLLNTPVCKLFFTRIIKENNIMFEEEISLGEDLLFNLEYYKHIKRFVLLKCPLYHYRICPQSLSHKYSPEMKKSHYLLLDRARLFFNNSNNMNLVNDFSMELLLTVLGNEFNNPTVCIVKRYFNTVKILSSQEFQHRLHEYKTSISKSKYLLLKLNMYLTYKLVNKIKKKGNNRVKEPIELKEQKEILVNILKYIDDICRKNNIQYTLVAGSLIGAIRHKGFIPWDDDIDIGLLPHNYDKLMKCLKADGNPLYRLLTVDTEKTYYYPFAKVVATYTSGYENGCKKIKNYGVYVDIFKYNYLPDDAEETNEYYYKVMSIKRKLGKSIYNSTSHLILKPLVWLRSLKNSHKLAKRFIAFSEQFNNKKGTSVMGNWPDHNATECILPVNIFDKYIDAKFENINVMIVKEYDLMLRKVFGDYMKLPPKEKRVSHHDMTIYRDDSYEK